MNKNRKKILNFSASLIIMCGMFALPSVAAAQTASYKLAWNQPEAPAIASTYQYTVKVDSGAAQVVTPTFVANGTGSSATAPIPTITGTGSHTVVLTIFNGFGSATGSLTGSAPSAPTTITITVTITVP